jgi:hypothetical protein
MMKLYERLPEKLLRVTLVADNLPTEHLTITETTLHEFACFVREAITPITKPHGIKTTIRIREAEGQKNGASQTISFKGSTPKLTKAFLIKTINGHGETTTNV